LTGARIPTVTLPSGRRTTVAAVARLIPPTAWETRSCGRGCKGHRDYAWAWAATSSPRHWILIRRSLSDAADLAFYYCHAPEGRPVSLPVLIKVAGKRWPVEECFAHGKGQAGLDQHQVRLWHSFHRHTVLSMCAQALLAVAAAQPGPPGSDPPAAGAPQRINTVTFQENGRGTDLKLVTTFRSIEDRDMTVKMGFTHVVSQGIERLAALLQTL